MAQSTMCVQYYILLIYTIECVDIEINGKVSLDLKISNFDLEWQRELSRENTLQRYLPKGENNKAEDYLAKIKKAVRAKRLSNITAAPDVECQYQYPEREHINAMLSNMMNQLAKMFIRVHEDLQEGESTRKQETRFRILDKRDTNFFEHIYNNMTNEYGQFYNDIAQRVDRTERDPCRHQEEIREMWKDLLEKSLATLRRAYLQCVEKYTRVQDRSVETRLRNQVELFLQRELERIRSSQLDVLCDKFQLCYNDLL